MAWSSGFGDKFDKFLVAVGHRSCFVLEDVRSPRLRRVATHGLSTAARDWFPGGLRADPVADAGQARVYDAHDAPDAHRPGALHGGCGWNAHRPFLLRGVRRRIASARLSNPFGVQLADTTAAAGYLLAHTAPLLSAVHGACPCPAGAGAQSSSARASLGAHAGPRRTGCDRAGRGLLH